MFRGNPFEVHNVRSILTNPFYSGYIENEFGISKGKPSTDRNAEMQDAVQKNSAIQACEKEGFSSAFAYWKDKMPTLR